VSPVFGHLGPSPERQADAEQLVGLLGRAIDAPVPAVLRPWPAKVHMDFVDGRNWPKYYMEARAAGKDDTAVAADLDRISSSRDGMRLGLLDALTGNWDRGNPENWFVEVDTDRPVGIDHAFAWEEVGQGLDPSEYEAKSPFLKAFVTYHLGWHWSDNPLTQSDIAFLRSRLAELEDDFALLGHHDWWEFAKARLEVLASLATGRDPIFT
jgi:hypothetical protein